MHFLLHLTFPSTTANIQALTARFDFKWEPAVKGTCALLVSTNLANCHALFLICALQEYRNESIRVLVDISLVQVEHRVRLRMAGRSSMNCRKYIMKMQFKLFWNRATITEKFLCG